RLAGKNRLSDVEAELLAVRNEVETRRREVEAAEAEVKMSAEAEAAARNRWRELQHESAAVRDRLTDAEREANRIATRLSALAEAKARLTQSRDETASELETARTALAGHAHTHDTEAQLAAVRGEIEEHRLTLAKLRGEAQALAREAELAARRLDVIASERADWSTRREGAALQITTLTQRIEEARSERESLLDA